MKIGTEEHKELFCQSFMDSYLKYEPENLPWPNLDSDTLALMRSIPFWGEALFTEKNAGVMVSAFAETITDPMIKDAIALQGREETRHGKMIEFLINHYQLEVKERPPEPIGKNIEKDFISFGYDECLDSFFAFGLFEIARQSGLFPETFFTIFDPILDEEARHIVFFVNWIAYLQINRGQGAVILRAVNSLWNYGGALMHLVDMVKGGEETTSDNFTFTGANSFDVDLTPELFLSTCIEQNNLRMSKFDARLLQPKLLPNLSGIAYNILKMIPKWK